MNKRWFYSKTLWVNSLAIVGMIAELLLVEQIIRPELHAVVLAIANLVLRTITDTKLVK